MTTPAEFTAIMAEFEASTAAELAFEAVRCARPTDPRHVAQQLRWYVEQLGAGERQDDALLLHAADVLEALGASPT